MAGSIHKIMRLCKYRYTAGAEAFHRYVFRLHERYTHRLGIDVLHNALRAGIVVLVGGACYGIALLPGRSTSPLLDTSARVSYMHDRALVPHDRGGQAGGIFGVPTGATIVASKKGTKYHYLWCASASKIAPKNRRYFLDAAAAEHAGYTLAATCKH